MPRKRDPTKPVHHRSHTGCDRCRVRRRRCDKRKPVCTECLAKGYQDCKVSLTLKWQQDFAAFGKAHGRSGVWSKNKGTSPLSDDDVETVFSDDQPGLSGWICAGHVFRWHFLNYFLHDMEEGTTRLVVSPRSDLTGQTGHMSMLSTPLSQIPVWRNFQGDANVDAALLSYYINRLCPITVPGSRGSSPFASLIIPLAHNAASPALLDSLMCLSASHRSRFDQSFRSTASSYAASALRHLRLAMKTPAFCDNHSAYAEVLVTVLLLCQSEITRSCDGSWVVHLKGAREMVRRYRKRSIPASGQFSYPKQLEKALIEHSSPTISFAEQYFAFHDVLGRTACGEEPVFAADFWSNLGKGDDSTIDPWLGCSPRLMRIVSTITELSWQNQTMLSSADGTLPPIYGYRSIDDIAQELSNLQQHCTQSMSSLDRQDSQPNTHIDSLLAALAEAKRLAVEVYFHSALRGATPASMEITSRVQQILQLVYVATTSTDTLHATGLLWPIFVSAVSLDACNEMEWLKETTGVSDTVPRYARPFVLYALEQQRDGLGNIDRVRGVIERVWKARERGRSAGLRNTGNSLIESDWRHYVAPYCHSMSLA